LYFDFPLTRFSLGFAFFAAGDALREAAASTAPGLRIPDSLPIFASTALNPGCALMNPLKLKKRGCPVSWHDLRQYRLLPALYI